MFSVCHLTSVCDLQPPLAGDVAGGGAHVVQHVIEQEVLVLVTRLRFLIQIQLVGHRLFLCVSVLGSAHFISTAAAREGEGGGGGGGAVVAELQVAADGGLQATGELTHLTAVQLRQEGIHQVSGQTFHLPTVQAGAHHPAHHRQGDRADVTVTLIPCQHPRDITERDQEEKTRLKPANETDPLTGSTTVHSCTFRPIKMMETYYLQQMFSNSLIF